MSSSDIIVLSSEEDDTDPKKIESNNKRTVDKTNRNLINGRNVKRDISFTEGEPKRKRIDSFIPPKNNLKEAESDEVIEVIKIVNKPKQQLLSLRKSNSGNRNKLNSNKIYGTVSAGSKLRIKPTLVVKEKHPVDVTVSHHDIFSMFLSQCLQRDKSSDMRKIVEKLKRKYEQLDPLYAHSKEFESLLNEKRNCLMYENGQVYKHIADINEIMKSKKVGKNSEVDSMMKTDSNVFDKSERTKEEPNDAKTSKQIAKIRDIERAMAIVQKRIKKYEESEVNWDDDCNSTYLITERYKERMVNLHAKWCELTGNHHNIYRGYLRPIHLKLTGIVSLDEAINSLVNSKIKNENNPRKNSATTSIFPDYIDVLNIIHEYNINKKLGMDVRAENSTAKGAFTKLGEYLKSKRQKDLYDSFSTMYDQFVDPATSHSELMQKLRENREKGDKNLNAIFDEYSKKQDEAKSTNFNDENKEDSGRDEKGSGDNSDSESSHSLESNITDLPSSSDDEAMIIHENENPQKLPINRVPEIEVVEKVSIGSLDIKCSDNHDISKDENSSLNEDSITDSTKTPSTSTTKANIDEILSNGLLKDEDIKSGLDDESKEEEKPLLKLRSFAKPPGFWQNSQECQNNDPAEKVDIVASLKSIELIELDNLDEQSNNIHKQISPIKIIENNNDNENSLANQSTNTPRKLTSAPLASVNKEVKVFRRLVTIPASQLAAAVKSNMNLDTVSLINAKLIRPASSSARPSRFVPLSAIEIRNQKSSQRTTSCILRQKISIVPEGQKAERNITVINPNESQLLRVNPINVSAPSKTTNKFKVLMLPNFKRAPIVIKNNKVKYLKTSLLNRKDGVPIIKQVQQKNNKNAPATTKIMDYNKNINNSVNTSNFIPDVNNKMEIIYKI